MKVEAHVERWAIARPFTIARGTKTVAEVVVATITDGPFEGRGECVPYPRYGESAADVAATIRGFPGPFVREALLEALPPGAARNAIDCALWDLAAKQRGEPAWALAGLAPPEPVVTAFTLSLGSAAAMGRDAAAARHRPLLKLKLGSTSVQGDIERLWAVRDAAPDARLIVDANEAWDIDALARSAPAAQEAGVELIEQPLPADADDALAEFRSPVPIAADESIRDGSTLAETAARYQAINIKLDKTGGLTQALRLARDAGAIGLDLMVGCMVSTSLSMAPALLLAQFARFVDLDGPLLLSRDREPGLAYNGACLAGNRDVWG